MNRPSINQLSTQRSGRRHVLGVVVIAALAFAAHGWSLGDGLFLDDHWHQIKLRQARWSFSDLLTSSTIEPARFVHAWWQDKPIRWDYSRPVTMAWMKGVQALGGGGVAAQHLAGIGWHACCCVLLYCLCFKLTRRWFWSLFAAVVFVIYPHNVCAVGWLASQNAVIQTALTLAAVLCYVRASGLTLHQGAAGFSPRGVSKGNSANYDQKFAHANTCGSLRKSAFAVVLVLFACGLFARENAVVFPALAIAFDLAFGGRAHLRARWKSHAILLGLAGAFAIWRINFFENHIPSAYLRRPEDWSCLLWYLAKLLHYVVCVVWQAPLLIGPMGYKNPFVESTADCALMAVVVVVFGGGYFLACRRLRAYWIWPVWILLAVLPVVPFFATPHMAYMAGVAFAIALVLKPASARSRSAPVSTAVAAGMLLLSVMAFAVYRICWRGVLAAEQYTIAQMTANPKPPPDSDVFLINLPLANVYLPLNLERLNQQVGPDPPYISWGPTADGPRTHVLTYAPHLLVGPELNQQAGPDPPYPTQGAAGLSPRGIPNTGLANIEQIDAHSFVLSIENERYFSGLLGRLLTEDMRQAGRFRQGEIVRGELFDAEILEADDGGVSRIKFTFAQPLGSERYRFYVITEDCPGAEVKFRRDVVGNAHPTIECAELEEAPDFRRKRDLLFKILDITAKIIRTDLYLTGNLPGDG